MGGNTIYAVVCTRTQVGSVLCWRGGAELPHGLGRAAFGLDASMAAAKTHAFAQNVFFFARLDCFFPWQGPSRPQEPESCTIYSTIQPTRKVKLLRRHPDPPAAAQKPGAPRFVNWVPGSPSRSCVA